MALEREKTNVQIGNMPYVRPANVLGSLATEVQQEAINRKKEIDAEEEQIEYATKTATFFNEITAITESQERPDAEAAGIAISKVHKRITSEKETPNPSVRRRLQASFQGIMSAKFNSILKAQTRLETQEAIERKKQAMETTLDVANLDAEAGLEENIGVYKGQIEQLGNELVSVSKGTITQSQANQIIREKQFEMSVSGIATIYTNKMNEGDAVGAEKYLTKAIESYGKTLKEEKGFRRLFADELKINGYEAKMQRAQIIEFNRFNAMAISDQEKYLVENQNKMDPGIYETYNKVVVANRLVVEGISVDDIIINMENQTNKENIELLMRKAIDKHPQHIKKITAARKRNISRLIEDEAKDRAKSQKLIQDRESSISYKQATEKQKNFEVVNPYTDSNGIPYNADRSATLITANNKIIATSKKVKERGLGAENTPLDNESDEAKFLDAQFEKLTGKALANYLNNDEIPPDANTVIDLGETIEQYNYIPKQIRNLLTTDVLQMTSLQMQKVSEIYYSILQSEGKHLKQDVTKLLADIPPDFKVAMKFARDASIEGIENFKKDAINTKGQNLVAGKIEEKTDQTYKNLDALPNALINGVVDSSYLGRSWDKWWNQGLAPTLSVSPLWSAYATVTRPSVLGESFRTLKVGGFKGIFSGFSASDFTSTMDETTTDLYKNALRQVHAETSNITDEEAAAFAIDKIADVTTPSVFMASSREGQDNDVSNLYQLHAYSPEAMLMNNNLPAKDRMSFDEVSIAMIETARIALALNKQEHGEKYLENKFNLKPDGPDSVLFTPAAANGALKVDVGVLMLSGRLAFKNGRKDRKTGEMSYEIHIATQSPTQRNEYVWRPIFVPGEGASAKHFPIGKNIPVLTDPKNRSFHSDLARVAGFAKDPSLLAPAAFYKTKALIQKYNLSRGIRDKLPADAYKDKSDEVRRIEESIQ